MGLVHARPPTGAAHRWQADKKAYRGRFLKTMQTRFAATILLVLILSACSSASQAPLPTETSQPVIEPTYTELPPAAAPEPENTPTFAPTTETNSNTGAPITDWEGIPVMPGAHDGELSELGYYYAVNVTVEEAEMYYVEKLEASGWALSNREIWK